MSFTQHIRPAIQTTRHVPSEQEVSKVLSFARGKPHTNDLRDIVHIVAGTGLRARELCNLRWSDIDFKTRCMMITEHKSMVDRRVPFTGKVARLLRARQKRQPVSDHVLGLVPRRVLDGASHQLCRFSVQLGGPRMTFYGLRRAFGNRWVNAGGSIFSLASILGYRSSFTTIREFVSPDQRFSVDSHELTRIEGRPK